MTTRVTWLTVKCYKGSLTMPISQNPHQIHYYINVDLLSDLAFLNVPFIYVKIPDWSFERMWQNHAPGPTGFQPEFRVTRKTCFPNS